MSKISQAFAGLDTNRSVGVFGDQRVWGYIVILRAVRTKDFMSAEVFNFDHAFLGVGHVWINSIASHVTNLSTLGCFAYHLQPGRGCVPCCL